MGRAGEFVRSEPASIESPGGNLAPHEVLRQDQSDRPRASGRRGREGLVEQFRGAFGIADGDAKFRGRTEDGFEIDLVIRAAFDIEPVGVDLAGEQNNGRRVGPGLGDTSQGVGFAGSSGGANVTRFARDVRIAIGHELPACSLRTRIVSISGRSAIAS